MTMFCCGVRQSTAPPGVGQCHPGLTTRPHGDGTVKRQLGSGLSPCPDNALPRLQRDSATQPALGRPGFFEGPDKRQATWAAGLTDAFFCSGVAKNHIPDIKSLTCADDLSRCGVLGSVDAFTRQGGGAFPGVVGDGHEKERSRLEHASIRAAHRGADMKRAAQSTSGVGLIEYPARPRVRRHRSTVSPVTPLRRTGERGLRRCAACLASQVAPAAGGTVKHQLGSGLPPCPKTTLPRAQRDSATRLCSTFNRRFPHV